MGRYLLLWMLGIPLPILALIYMFGGLHCRRALPNNTEINQQKRRPVEAAFSVSCHWRQPPLPPITARTVSSGPKSSAPST